MILKKTIPYILLFLFAFTYVHAQEDSPFVTYDVPSQNLLKYNRFLINPTFSTVREDKSYINLLHRNQSVQFDDNNQNYFLSYSGRISDRTGLGLSLYSQREGILNNFGVLANYAYGIKLSDKSNFTFGANVSYYNSGINRNRTSTVDPNDPLLNGLQDSNLLSFQPGFNLSYGKFDFGVFAENLFDYNLKTSQSLTAFQDKTFSSHLQYTHPFDSTTGIFENGRLMPLARVRKVGENDIVLGGSLILDLPKLGWIQGGYDNFYGAAAGIGFNLNQRISLGYTMEKGLSSDFDNFGLTHEISFAYSFTPNLTEDRVMLEENGDDLVENSELITDQIATNEELEELKKKLAENDAILAELMFRQDSLEANRQKDLERRFEMVMRMVRKETKGGRPDLERKAEDMFLGGAPKTALADNSGSAEEIIPTGTKDPKLNNASNNAATESKVDQKDLVSNDKKSNVQSVNKDIIKNESRIKNTTSIQDKIVKNTASDNTNQTNPIKSRKFRNLEGVQDGYYMVANVYKGGQYLTKFIDDLKEQGLNANYIDNPSNGLKYVYLQRFDTWQEAVDAHNSKVNGSYNGDLWVLNVDNRYSNERYADNVNKIKEKSSKYATDVLQKNVVVRDEVATNEPKERTFNIDGVGSGYYIIANVFANANNAKRFVKLLNSYGLSASYFINPENNWRYVYLKKHDSWNNALVAYYSKLNDSYNDKMWIMRITPNKMA